MITTAAYNTIANKAMKESVLLDFILKAARLHGWQSAHFRPGMTQRGRWVTAVSGNGVGFPDLVLARSDRIIFAELKSEKGKLTQEQLEWVQILALVPGVEVYIWRPSNLDEAYKILEVRNAV